MFGKLVKEKEIHTKQENKKQGPLGKVQGVGLNGFRKVILKR